MSSTKHYAPPYCVESVFDDTLAVDICLDYEVPEEGRPVLIACIMGGDGDLRDRHRAEATAKFVVRACNAHAALVELARFVIAEAEYLPHVLADAKAKALAALGTISPSSETIARKSGTTATKTGTIQPPTAPEVDWRVGKRVRPKYRRDPLYHERGEVIAVHPSGWNGIVDPDGVLVIKLDTGGELWIKADEWVSA